MHWTTSIILSWLLALGYPFYGQVRVPGPGGNTGTAPAIVQHLSVQCLTATTCTATFPNPVAVGDAVLASAFDGFGTSLSLTYADGTNTYTQITFGGNVYCNIATDGDTLGASYAVVGTSAAYSVTVSDGGNSSNKRMEIVEISHWAGIDQTVCGNPTGTTVSSGNTSATTQSQELAYAFMGNAGTTGGQTITAGAGYTGLDFFPSGTFERAGSEYENLTSAGVQSATFVQTASQEAGVILVTIK